MALGTGILRAVSGVTLLAFAATGDAAPARPEAAQ